MTNSYLRWFSASLVTLLRWFSASYLRWFPASLTSTGFCRLQERSTANVRSSDGALRFTGEEEEEEVDENLSPSSSPKEKTGKADVIFQVSDAGEGGAGWNEVFEMSVFLVAVENLGSSLSGVFSPTAVTLSMISLVRHKAEVGITSGDLPEVVENVSGDVIVRDFSSAVRELSAGDTAGFDA